MNRIRDNIAWALCAFALNYIATEYYRKMIAGSIRYGLTAAAKYSKEKR